MRRLFYYASEALRSPPSEQMGSMIKAAILLSDLNKLRATSRHLASSLRLYSALASKGYFNSGNSRCGHWKAGSPTLCSLLVLVKDNVPYPRPWKAFFMDTTL